MVCVWDKYELIEKVGQGTFGKVFKAREKATGQMVALKKTRMRLMCAGIPACSLREIANFKLLSRCKHIVKLLAVEIDDVKGNGKLGLYMVFEYMDCDLLNFYERCSSYNETVPPIVIKRMMYQLVKGIEYCHRHGLMHRDLKPQNLLLDMDAGILKVADLGLGRVLRNKFDCYTEDVITPWYRPPELLLGELDYSFAIDIWSIGCIFAELCIMKPFLTGENQLSQIITIFKMLGTPNEEVWPGLSKLKYGCIKFPKFEPKNLAEEIPCLDESGLDLLSKMLQLDPSKRISARNALSHPYFLDPEL